MSNAATTIRNPADGPSFDLFDRWAADAVSLAATKLGQREQGGRNMGPIVEWSLQDLTSRKPGPNDWAKWCAAFVSQCYLQTAPTPELRKAWLAIASTSCDRLWEHLERRGRTQIWTPSQAVKRGWLAFYGTAKDIQHVGLVARPDPLDACYESIEGNTGNEVASCLWDVQTGLRLRPMIKPGHALIYGFADVRL